MNILSYLERLGTDLFTLSGMLAFAVLLLLILIVLLLRRKDVKAVK